MIFFLDDGSEWPCPAGIGDTVMDVALDNRVPGIIAQCGGGATCCTCHCWLREPWRDRFEAPHRYEADLLPYAWGYDDTDSRLSCQLVLTETHDGLEVHVPEQQA